MMNTKGSRKIWQFAWQSCIIVRSGAAQITRTS